MEKRGAFDGVGFECIYMFHRSMYNGINVVKKGNNNNDW